VTGAPLRVAMLTYSVKPRGGVVHAIAVAEALAARGHAVELFAVGPPGAAFFRAVQVPARVVEHTPPDADFDTRIAATIAAYRDGLRPILRDGGFDVVHAQDCISANALPACVRTVHHLDRFTTPVLADCHERAIVSPRAHVCVSAAVAAELRAGWGIRACVIPNGVEAGRFEAAARDHGGRARWRERLGDRPFVLAVGGIEPRKGTLDLVEAMALVPEARLVVAGGETLFDYRDYRAGFDRRCAELGLDVEVLGPVDHEALPALVAEADAFAFPSTKEGFGLAAMEALAAGVPVVARDLPVLHEVFGDTVAYAADVPAVAAALRRALAATPDPAAGRALARAHTWEAAARAHVAFYGSLAGGGGPGAAVVS
jgi:glycosyltransferase-like protein